MEISRREFLGQAVALPAAMPRGRRIAAIDCTKELPPESYFSHGETRVVASAIGGYREAEGKHAARFGYRFRIENT